MKKNIFLSLFFLFFLSLTLTQIITTDTWWNLADGRLFFNTGQIPAADPYSYHPAEHIPWVNGAWLAGVLLYPIYTIAGGAGLVLLECLVIALAFYVLAGIRSRPASLWTWFSLALVLIIGAPRFQVRSELFGLLSEAILLRLLYEYQCGMSARRMLLASTALMIFWANVHPSFAVGMIIFTVFLFGEALSWFLDRRGVMTPEPYPVAGLRFAKLIGISLAALLATGVSPYGYRTWSVPYFFLAHRSTVIQHLGEWIPLDAYWLKFAGPLALASIGLAAALGLCTAALNHRKMPVSWNLLWLLSLFLFKSSVRHQSFFAMATLPVLVLNGSNLREPAPWIRRTAAVGLTLFLVLVTADRVTDRSVLDHARYEAFGLDFYRRTIPEAAVRFAREKKLPGPIFNSYDLGSYLLYHWPEQKVFIDTRYHLRGAEDFSRYIDLMREPATYWPELEKRYGVKTALIKHPARDMDFLLAYLFKRPDWAVVFVDEKGIIFLKRTPENAPLIETLSPSVDTAGLFDRTERNYTPHWFWGRIKAPRWLAPREIPFEPYWVAHLYFKLGMYDRAEPAFRRVLRSVPDLYEIYYFLGKIAAEEKDFKKAVSLFETALTYEPDFPAAKKELVLSRTLAGIKVISLTDTAREEALAKGFAASETP